MGKSINLTPTALPIEGGVIWLTDIIQTNVLTHESIGSLSNCGACHTGAEKGIYDDDSVTIPR